MDGVGICQDDLLHQWFDGGGGRRVGLMKGEGVVLGHVAVCEVWGVFIVMHGPVSLDGIEKAPGEPTTVASDHCPHVHQVSPHSPLLAPSKHQPIQEAIATVPASSPTTD